MLFEKRIKQNQKLKKMFGSFLKAILGKGGKD